MPELTTTSPYVNFKVDSNTCTMGIGNYNGRHYARVDLNPMLESAVSPSQGVKIWPLIFIVNVRLTRRFLKNHVNIKFDLLKLLRQIRIIFYVALLKPTEAEN
jgi:hypothetical protein